MAVGRALSQADQNMHPASARLRERGHERRWTRGTLLGQPMTTSGVSLGCVATPLFRSGHSASPFHCHEALHRLFVSSSPFFLVPSRAHPPLPVLRRRAGALRALRNALILHVLCPADHSRINNAGIRHREYVYRVYLSLIRALHAQRNGHTYAWTIQCERHSRRKSVFWPSPVSNASPLWPTARGSGGHCRVNSNFPVPFYLFFIQTIIIIIIFFRIGRDELKKISLVRWSWYTRN